MKRSRPRPPFSRPHSEPVLYALGTIVLGAVALGLGSYTLSRRKAEGSDDTQIPKLMIGAGLLLVVAAAVLLIAALTGG